MGSFKHPKFFDPIAAAEIRTVFHEIMNALEGEDTLILDLEDRELRGAIIRELIKLFSDGTPYQEWKSQVAEELAASVARPTGRSFRRAFCLERPFGWDVPSLEARQGESKMFRLQSLVFAALLMSSATAFAADTPDPNASGAAGLPSGSNAASPPSADESSGLADSKKDVPAMTPGPDKNKTPNPQ